MINILYVCSTLKRTGPTNQLLNIISNLPDTFKVTVCTLSPEEKDTLKQSFEEKGIRVISLNMSRLKGLLLLKAAFRQLIKELCPDVIHSQGLRADSLVANVKSSSLKVATVRNYLQLDYPLTYGRIVGSLMAFTHAIKLKKFNSVVGVSSGVSENLSERFKILDPIVIHNGVDTRRFSSLEADKKSELRDKLGLPIDKKIWISVGHLSSRKNPINIIESFQKYQEVEDRAALIFVGDGPLQQDCIKHASDNIIFLGRVSNVQDYLKASDYFVSASKAEGFPNTVLESLACGLPVLLSDITPHKEFFGLNKNIGLMFDVKCGCQDQMSMLTQHNYDILQNEATKVIIESLSASVMSTRYQEIYLKGGK